jgi:uracil-DNA glycosylase family 4
MTSNADGSLPNTTGVTKPSTCLGCPLYAQRRVLPDGVLDAPILLLGDHPSKSTPRGQGPFQDRPGLIIGAALSKIHGEYRRQEGGGARLLKLKTCRTYAVQCVTDDKPAKETADQCRQQNFVTLVTHNKPRVVVAFGAEAMRYLLGSGDKSHKLKFDNMRGTFTEHILRPAGVRFSVFVTYSPKAVFAQPGLFNELVRDLRKVYAFVEGRLDQTRYSAEFLRSQYRFPRTVDEVRDLCDEIIGYARDGGQPDKWLISVDTETSSLEPHDPLFKIICVSFAWDALKSAAIILDHPQTWWSPSELEQVKYHVCRVLACAKPKTLHHEKFDRQGIVHHYHWPLENVVWDTMGGEHLIEEDKQGEYGLKSLTRARLPKYAGYEDKVQEIREAHGGLTRAQENKRYRKAAQKYDELLVDYHREIEVYEQARAACEIEQEKWQKQYKVEKDRAAAARKAGETDKQLRRICQNRLAKKPKVPKRPREPEKPERREPFDYTMIPIEDLMLYAAVDTDVGRQHVLHQNNRLNAEYAHDCAMRKTVEKAPPPPAPVKRMMKTHVLPTSRTFAQMEFTGFPVDMAYLEDLDQKLKVVVEETEDKLYQLAGRRFVIGNPKEVTQLIFVDGFYDEASGGKRVVHAGDDVKRTARGQIKADEKSLLYVANTFKYEFPKLIVRHRKASKARSPFLTNVREHAVIDGRMHPSFHLTGTSTNRSSSSNENMQNFPKKLAGYNIKKIFIPLPGYVLCNVDAKGAEVRIFAAHSHDKELIKSINDGLDTHSYFTAEIYPDRYNYQYIEDQRKECDRLSRLKSSGGLSPELAKALEIAEAIVKQRTNTKRVVFGTLYGAQAAKIAETAGISKDEAQKVIDGLFRRYPSIPAYIHLTEKEVELFNSIYTFTGWKRRFPLSDRQAFRSRCCRQAVNCKIQTDSSNIVLSVLNQIAPVITNELQGYLHATVHDSIVFSVPPKYVMQVPEMMREYGTERVAREYPWLPVKFLWDVEAGVSYGETVDILEYAKGLPQDEHTEVDEEILSDDEIREQLQEIAE